MFKIGYSAWNGEPEVTTAPEDVLEQMTDVDVDATVYRAIHADSDD